VFTRDRIFEGKTMLLRIVSMLCGLVDRFDQTGGSLHEDAAEYRISPEVLSESRRRTRTRTRTNKTA
jgi:hypothetical protein